MARNKLIDVKDSLMASLEDLDNENLTGEELENELKKCKAKIGIAQQVTNIYKLSLDAVQLASQGKFVDTTQVVEQFKLTE